MSKNIVWRLLRKNISAAQIAGYAIANLVGLSIVLTAIQFYRDVNSLWSKEDSFISKDYMIISKKVSGLNTINSVMGSSNSKTNNLNFSSNEIENLQQQPWVRRVGNFTAAQFDVYASMEMGGRRMATHLFFESIPDEYFDIQPDGWVFDPATPEIPIIMSKDYLTLYNFGFASSRGMPQLSESLIGKVVLDVRLSGNGLRDTYKARIVGFSSRLNTIAVPQSFMDWANARYAPNENIQPSRLIIEIGKPGDPAIKEYLKENGYESAGEKADDGKASYFFTIVTGIVIAVGGIISLLAFFILLLSIYLLLQKNREKLHELMLLGYSPRQVAKQYYILVGVVNMSVLILAIIIMYLTSGYWIQPLATLEVETSSHLYAITIGAIIMAAITLGNFIAIARTTRRYFNS